MKKLLISFLILILVFTMTACSSSQTKSEGQNDLNINMALFHTENDAFAQIFKKWADQIEQQTEGRVKITPHYSGSLVNLFDTLDAVANGAVDAGILSAGAISGQIPSLGLLEIIGVFPNEESFKNVYQDATPLLNDIFLENDVKLLFWAPGGIDTLAFHRDKTLVKPADFKNLKMRTAGRWQAEQVKMLEASPVTMDPSELYLALQNGTVDSTFQTTGLANAAKLYEVASKITSLSMPINTVQWVINPDVWSKISKEDQEIIEQISREVALNSYSMIETAEKKDKENIEQNGGEIYVLTEEERQAFYDLFITVSDKIVKQSGEKGEKLNAILEKYR